jgi:predicted RNA-binding Zn-ribbon protein involved in translation (DUF1610 family)
MEDVSRIHYRCGPGWRLIVTYDQLAPAARRTWFLNGTRSSMADVDFHEISFQCPKCGHDIKQTIGRLKAKEHMACPGCGVGINIDTNRLADATEEIQIATGKIPPEITIKFFR